jgi:molecular chaperone GrpE
MCDCIQVKAETEAEQKINNSYQSLYKQMVDIMRGLGIEAVPTTGSPFDPEVHEAIMREPNDEVADGTVLQEFRKGFRLGSKLLRPAMVKVRPGERAAEGVCVCILYGWMDGICSGGFTMCCSTC